MNSAGRRRDAVVIHCVVSAPGAPVGKRVDMSARIKDLKYDDEEKKSDKIQLEVDNFDLQAFEAPLWRKGNEVRVSWGYPGEMAPERLGIIHKITGGKLLKVICLDKGILFHKEHKVRTWENMTRAEVAKKIAEEYHFDEDRQFIQPTSVRHRQVTQGRMTDFQLLSDMAKREGYEWFIDFDGFHFHERQLGQRPIRQFIYYTDPNAGDLIDWEILNELGHRKAGKVTAQGRDPITKEDFEHAASNDGTPRHGLSEVIDVVNRDDLIKHAEPLAVPTARVVPTTEQTKDAAKAHADGSFKQAQLEAVKMKVTAWGDPIMIGKTVVRMSRMGNTLSGNYFVTTVSHNLGPSVGYKMVLTMRRDGRNAPTTNAFDAVPGQGQGVKSDAAKNDQSARKDRQTVEPKDVVDRATGQKTIEYRESVGRQISFEPLTSSSSLTSGGG